MFEVTRLMKSKGAQWRGVIEKTDLARGRPAGLGNCDGKIPCANLSAVLIQKFGDRGPIMSSE